MADQTWNNGTGGNWGTAANWIGGIPNGTAADATITTAGAYTVTLAAGTTDTADSVVFDNASASFEQAGTLVLGGTLASFTFDGDQFILGAAGLVSGGTLDIDSGELLDQGGKLQTKQFILGENGTLALNGKALALAGNALLDGDIYGNGAAGNSLMVTGTASITSPIDVEDQATLVVAGTLSETGPENDLYLGTGAGDGAALDILSGGTFNLSISSAYSGYDAGITNESASTVFNAGRFVSSNANGDFYNNATGNFIQAALINTGTLESDAGQLYLEDGGTIGGTLSGAGEIDFYAGSFSLSPALSVSAATLGFETGGTVQLGGNITLANTADFLGGTVALAGHTITLAGNDDLNGVILGTGGNAVSQVLLTGTAGGAELDFEDNATLVDAGMFILNANGGFDLEFGNFSGLTDSSALTIKAGGVFDMAGTPQNTIYADAITEFDGSGTIANAGLLEATGYAGALVDPFINSTGTLLATAGADLKLQGGAYLGGKLTGAGEIDLDSGTFTLSPTLSVSVGTLGFNGGVVALGGNVSIAGAGAVIDGAVIDLNGHNLTLNNPELVSGNDITGAGEIIVLGNATFSNYDVTNGETLVDAGTITETGGFENNLQLGLNYPDSATLVINSGAIYNLLNQPGGVFADIGGPAGNGAVINAGLFDATGGGAIDSYVVNTGNIEASAADLQLQNGGTLGGRLTGAGEIDFDGGQFALSPNVAISVATLGFLGGAAILGGNLNLTASTLNGNDDSRSTGGTIALNGHNVTLGSGALGINGGIYGPGTAIVVGSLGFESMGVGNGATLADAGTITETGGFENNLQLGLNYPDSATLLIESKGTFNLLNQPGGVFADIGGPGGDGAVINAGLFDATGGGAIDSYVVNTGNIEASAADLQLQTGGTIGGTLTGNGEIDFDGGQFTLSPSISISVATLGFLGGAAILGGNLNLTASTLNGNDDVRQSGGTIALNGHNATLGSGWLGINAGIYGPGTAIVLGSIGFESMLVGGGATLADAGTITETGGLESNLQLGQTATDPGTLLIESGGTFNLLTEPGDLYSDIVQYSQGYGDGLVINAGLLDVADGAPYIFLEQIQVYLVNSGTLEANQVDLQLQGGSDLGGTLAGTGEIELQGGNFTLAPGLVSDVALLQIDSGVASTLAGNVDLTGNVAVAGATIALNGHNLTLASAALSGNGAVYGPGTLVLTGTASNTGFDIDGGATLEVAGTLVQNASNNGFYMTNGGADTAILKIDDGAVYDVWGTPYYGSNINDNGGGGTILNAGLIDSQYSAAEGYSNVFIATMDSTGTIESDVGAFQLYAGGTLGGLLTGAGEIDLNSGVFNLAPGISITVAQLGIGGEVIAGGNLAYAGAFNLGPSGVLYLNGDAVTLSGTAALNGNVEASGDLKITGQAVAGGLYVSGGAVLEDASTITQTGYLQLGNGDSGTLAIDKGAVYNLQNQAGNAEDINESGNGTILNAGLFELTGYNNGIGAQIYAGLQNTGTITDFGAGMLNFDANVVNDALITLSSRDYPIGAAAADFEGALTADAGKTGTIALGANAVLYAAGTVTNQNILFTTAGTLGSELQIGDLAAFSGTVAGFAGGDVIDIEQLQANGFTYANNILTLTEAQNGGTAALVGTLALSSVSGTIALDADGNGGTNILLNEPAGTYSNPKTAPTISTWNAGTGSWSTAANWTPSGVPGANTDAQIAANSGTITISYATNSTLYELSNNDNNAKFSLTGGKLMLEAGGGSYGEVVISAANFDALTGFNFYGLASLASNGTLEADTGGMNFYGGAVLAGTIAGDGRLDGSLYFTSGNVLLNAGLTVQSGAANLDFDGAAVTLGASQTLAAPVEISSSSFDFAGHTLVLGGASVLGESYYFTGLSGPGTLDITGTAALGAISLYGGANLADAGLILQNNQVYVGNAETDTSAILISAGGTYALEDDAAAFGISEDGIGSLKNAGLLELTGYGNDTDVIALPVLNTGTILAAEGDLQLVGGGTLGGKLAGAGEIDLTVNTFGLSPGLAVSVATFGLLDDGSLNLNGTSLAISGYAELGNNTSNAENINGAGTLDITGTANAEELFLEGNKTTLEVAGTVNQLGASALGLDYRSPSTDTSALVIDHGGTYDMVGSGEQILWGGGSQSVVNNGLLETSGVFASGQVDQILAPFINTGTVLVNTGDLQFTNGGTLASTLAGAGEIDLTAGNFLLNSLTASVAVLNVSGSDMTLGSNVSISAHLVDTSGVIDLNNHALTLSNAADALTGTLEAPGTISFASGVQFGLGSQTARLYGPGTFVSQGTVTVADLGYYGSGGSEALDLDNGLTWNNTGTVIDAGEILLGVSGTGNATISNQAGAVFELTTNDAGLVQYNSGTYALNNAGLLEKTGGTGISQIQAAVTNTGTILATAGVLELDGGGPLGGTLGGGAGTVALVGIFGPVSGGTDTVSFGSNVQFGLGGYDGPNAGLAGPGTFVSQGTVTAADLGYYGSGGNEALDLDNGLTWNNTGTVIDAGEILLGVSGSANATINNAAGALFDLTTNDANLAIFNQGTYALNNAGLLENTGNTGVVTPQLIINNTGTILATTGVLALGYGGSLGGTYGGGAGTVALVNGYSIAKGVAETATFASGGQFGLASNNAQMYLSGPGTFASAGTLTIADLGYAGISGNQALNLGAGLTWKNTGTVNDFGEVILGETYGDTVTLTNTGTFNLAGSDASLLQYGGPNPQPYNFTNAGLLENSGTTGASGAALINAVEATLTNTGTILATTGALELPYLINAGTVLAAAGAMIVIGGESPGNALGAGLGNFSGSALGGTFGGAGTIALVGTYQLTAGKTESATFGGNVAFGFNTPATQAYLTGAGTFVSAGTLAIADLGTPGNSSFPGLNLGYGAVWHNTGTVTEYGALILGENYNDTGSISNAGTWNLADDDASLTQYGNGPNAGIFTFTNSGLLEKTGGPGLFGATQPDVFQATLANTGTVLAAAGELDVDFVANNVNGTLTGGTWESTNGLLELAGAISTDAANIILSGASAAIETVNAPTPIEASLQYIAAKGTLQILGGRGFAAENPLTDAGTLILGGGELSDSVTIINGTEYGLMINHGGLIEGFGEIAFVAQNNGEILANAAGQALDVVFSTFLSATGTGTLGIAANSSLELGGIVGTGQTIAFGGTHALLAEEPGVVLSGTIAGLAPGDTIDIATTTVSAATLSGDNLFITLSGGTVLDQALSAPITGERFEITSDGSTGSDLVLYREAADTITPNPVGFGNHHVGDTVAVGLTLANTQPADGYSEALDASFSSHLGSISTSGAVAALAAGATATALSIGLLTATAGSISGDAVVTLASDGKGSDGDAPVSLGTQTIGVTGAVYAYAGPTLGASTLALIQVHTNVSDDVVVTLANTAANPAYTEALDARFSGASGAALATGTITQLAAGGNNSNNLIAGLTTSTAGSFAGAVTLALTSDGTALDGLGLTTLAAQTIALSGSVFNLATASPEPGTISLGEHHTGASADVYLTLGNAAAPGAYSEKLDASFSGTSLATGSFSAGGSLKSLAAGTTSVVTLELKAGTGAAGAIAGEAFVTLTSDGTGVDTLGLTGLGIDSLAVTGAVYNLATAALAATTISLGEHHAGLLSSASISLQNSAAPGAYSEGLDAKFTGTSLTSGSFTTGGTITALAAGSSSTALGVTLSGAGGSIAGTATLGLTSDGTGIDTLGLTALSAQTLAVSGTLFNEATAALSPATLALGDFHTGAAATGMLTLTNTAAKGIYSEALDANFTGSSLTHGSFSASGTISELAAGATGSLAVTLATGAAGSIAGTATLALTSDGTGIDTLGLTGLTAQVETITGAVFAYAAPTLASTIINFGIVHTGSTLAQDLVLSNGTASPYMENLDASFSGTSSGFISAGTVSALKAGATNSTGLALGIATTDTAGIISGTATLALTSDGAGIDTLGPTSLGTQIITLAGTIDNYATAALEEISGAGTLTGSGGNYFLNLGNVQQGQGSLAADIGVLNAATGVADNLSGSFVISNSGGFTDTGFGTFSGIAAGQADRAPAITLSSANAGAFSELITLTPVGGNASGYAGAEPNITLDVTGDVLHTYTLTTGADTIAGAGNDLIVAKSGQLSAGDIINAGTGTNILTLSGGGVFDMRAPATLTGITTVEAQENIGTAAQTLYLEAGFTGTVNAASGPAGSSLVVYGNLDSATINLGSGNDTIYVGSSLETINAGGGNDVFYLANADAGATLNGGSGSNTLVVAGGGSFAMGANISSISNVVINELPTQSETFVANSSAGLAILGGAGNDTITLGAATQSVVTGTGNTVIYATAAQAGAAITNEGNATLDLTNGGNATLNVNDDFLTVSLNSATNLTLSALPFITAIGSAGNDTITAMAMDQTLTGGPGIDTLIGYAGFGDMFQDTASGLNTDTIKYFGGNDLIDITNLARAGATLGYIGNATNGTLTVSNGAISAHLTLSAGSNLSQSLFHMTSDGHGGTYIALI